MDVLLCLISIIMFFFYFCGSCLWVIVLMGYFLMFDVIFIYLYFIYLIVSIFLKKLDLWVFKFKIKGL